MKILNTALSFSLVLSGITSAKEYILDKKNYMPPVGHIEEKKSSFKIVDAEMTFNIQGKVMKGTTNANTTRIQQRETLAKNKYKALLKSDEKVGNTIIAGKEMPLPDKGEALLGVPIILEKMNGSWIVSPEQGKFTEEQKIEAEKIAKKKNASQNLSMYGYEARNVGDEWDVDLKAMSILLGDSDLKKGTAKVMFKSIEQLNGRKCANLLLKVDAEGVNEDGLNMKMSGEVKVLRDLKFFTDLKVSGKLDVNLTGELDNGGTMNIVGVANIDEIVTVKDPQVK